MRRTIHLTFILFLITLYAKSQTINLAGQWEFQIDRNDIGLKENWQTRNTLNDAIELPASMPERLKGDDISVNTKWVGSLYDSSYFFNPYMEKYRKPGKDMKLTFFLTPDKHYVGVAWYGKKVNIAKVDNNSSYSIYLERPHIETTLFVNGRKVGMQNSLVCAHQYDVSSFLKDGENRIMIRIDNRPETVNVGQDSHSITDQTQGDWNGIVGKMEFRQTSATHITDMQVFPDVDKMQALVRLQIRGKAKEKVSINMKASADGQQAAFEYKGKAMLTADTTNLDILLPLHRIIRNS